ncbi:translesion error-prone DNA polymerase V subunit UmuC [Flavobacterium sp.]|uniref:translesion error-prone DNA polymerase V subunit UmuC n=1 Tax=Flavobacterium sp. TaxID=239 RepID=UPI0026106FD9|nr:translesion error-prone DNA polymerase V subunit UmuC [Flavobacterium sp.]
MNQKTFALVDCNNFYASCEKLFRPDLALRPVVVLSNNDGCVIARSKEAKALGIKMGVPLFQIRDLIEKHHIQTFSSNYALYADMSARVMQTLEEMAPAVEVYSIDEAFLDLTGIEASSNLTEFGQAVRQRIQQWVGLTVCVGIAPTKTLAKLANHAAKAWSKTGGVLDLTSKERQRKLMALLPVNEVWGIGGKLTKRLEAMGIHTALQLADAPPKLIRQQFSLMVERTVQELNGESCLALEDVPPTKKEIVSSRAFGERVTAKQQMQQAVAEYVHRACAKLRNEGCQAKQISVFIRTSPFSDHTTDPYYANTRTAELTYPSNDTRDFLHVASKLLDNIWKDGYRYAKAGVMLSDFYTQGVHQQDMFTSPDSIKGNSALMSLVDQINERQPNALFFGSKGTVQDWGMKRELLSPAYTTNWQQLPNAW